MRRRTRPVAGRVRPHAAAQPLPPCAFARPPVRPVTAIGRAPRRRARISHRQASAAAPAGQHARQQRPAASAGLASANPTVSICGQQGLVPLVLRPVDVAFMMIVDQHVPGFGRLAVTVGLARPPVHQLDPLLAFAVGISSCVERVLQETDDIAIADLPPVEGREALPIRRTREEHALRRQRQARGRHGLGSNTSRITFCSRMSGSRPSPMSRCQT